MASLKFYIMPLDQNGNYTSFQDITRYVQQIGSVSIDTDSSDFNIGIYRTSNVQITLSNRDGFFSDVGSSTSIFEYTRANSVVKITYVQQSEGPYAGVMTAGEDYLSDEIEIYRGLLNDEATTLNVRDELANFQILGYESVLDNVVVPFSLIANGQLMSSLMYTFLNQVAVLKVLTVSALNISPDLDYVIDDVSGFENQSVKDAIDELLLLSNSVLYVKDLTVYVVPRTATATVQKTFYGQASQLGPENILDILNLANGASRTFNLASWSSNGVGFENVVSAAKYGVKAYSFDQTSVTNTLNQIATATSVVNEFGLPKRELDLVTDLNYSTVALNLLDRVAIDYPTVYTPQEFALPICGIAICGNPATATLPKGLWNFQIDTTVNFKIIKKTLDLKKFQITFHLREI